ncbi:hypothetical protein [Clostridium botulinum]|uniref:hypothetical protein n=1 Tax=Clostridium botulinum TaxID=1491 RepID=UPI003DA37C1E
MYASQHDEDECRKEIVVKAKEKQKLDDCEEIRTVSFLDYKTSNDSIGETIGDELLEENNEVISDVSEPNCKSDISTIPIECHSIFVQSNRTIEDINCKSLMLNMKCHSEGGKLYPP